MDINRFNKDIIKFFDNRIKNITVQELSLVTGFKPRTIYNWIHREPDFPYVKWGKAVRFDINHVMNWLENRSN